LEYLETDTKQKEYRNISQMAQRFTINETVVTQKICNNCTRMKGINSYLHTFFLFIRAKKPTIADYIPPHMIKMTSWTY
jgi:hypothetical protein